ncbi:MAG: homoserine kinase, partial [bacterium]
TLGLALKLYNIFEVNNEEPPGLEIYGEGAEILSSRENNTFLSTIDIFAKAFRCILPPLKIRVWNSIPLCKGLGSSATAIVAGLLVANSISGKKLTKKELLKYAVEIEGHPDNVSAAMFGGCTVSLFYNDKIVVKKIPFPDSLSLIVAIPEFDVPTGLSRTRLPRSVPFEVATRGLARIGTFIASIVEKDLEELSFILEDELHEPYREEFIPNYNRIKREILERGAIGVMISGSGPTIVILTCRDKSDTLYKSISEIFTSYDLNVKLLNLEIDDKGAVLEV